MNTWLVMVNATKYNLFGAARKYGDGIPWFFDGTQGAAVGDEVLFYFTSSDPSSDDEGYGKNIIGSLYQRVVFEGVITEIDVDLARANRDIEFWSEEHAQKLKKTCKELVIIKIVKPLYNQNITSGTFNQNIWTQNRKTYVVKL